MTCWAGKSSLRQSGWPQSAHLEALAATFQTWVSWQEVHRSAEDFSTGVLVLVTAARSTALLQQRINAPLVQVSILD